MRQLFVLRCFVDRDEQGQWSAVCIDLNLAAQGDSPDEARRSLDSIVESYVREAVTTHREHFGDLIPRRAPLALRLRYHVIKLGHLARRLFGRTDGDGKNSFLTPLTC